MDQEKSEGMKSDLKQNRSLEAGGHTAGVKTDSCFEGIRIDAAAFSFDERHLPQNLIGPNRIIENNSSISAKNEAGLKTED